MFSDLSDKLFTSEIIEMHEEKETNDELASNTDQNTSNAGSSVPSDKSNVVSSAVNTNTNKPMLEDLGKFLFS